MKANEIRARSNTVNWLEVEHTAQVAEIKEILLGIWLTMNRIDRRQTEYPVGPTMKSEAVEEVAPVVETVDTPAEL